MQEQKPLRRVTINLDEDTYTQFIQIKHKYENDQKDILSFSDIATVCIKTTSIVKGLNND